MMKPLTFLTAALSALLMCACSYDYRADAVEHARTYALDHSKPLSALQLAYIRYNDPVIMDSLIWDSQPIRFDSIEHIQTRFSKDTMSSKNHDLMQQCMVWNVPGMTGSLVVVGTGERSFKFWSPDRLLVKNFNALDTDRENARIRAADYVLNALPGITPDEADVIRFADPQYLRTDFPVKYEPPKIDPDKGGWMEYLKESAREDEPKQISIAWFVGGRSSAVVVTGLSKNGFAGWTPKGSAKISGSELEKHIIRGNP